MITLADALVSLRPEGEWALNGDDFSSLVWFSDDEPPTLAEVEVRQAELEAERVSLEFRAERNRRLADCDWTQLPDAPTDKAAWAAYRAALRELPEVTSDPADVVWPLPPQ